MGKQGWFQPRTEKRPEKILTRNYTRKVSEEKKNEGWKTVYPRLRFALVFRTLC